MKKKLKDYLHLYPGNRILVKCLREDIICQVMTVGIGGGIYATGNTKDGKIFNIYGSSGAKLILRHLSDIKKEDIDLGDLIPEFEISVERFTGGGYCIDLDSIHEDGYCLTIYPDGSMFCICKDNGENYPYHGSEIARQLRSKGFDLDELIQEGLAIDATTINNELQEGKLKHL